MPDYIRLSTTVATNTLLERKDHEHALLITKGFKDLLLIGNESRPKIFDLNIRRPPPLYSAMLEADERVTLADYTSDPEAEKNAVQFEHGNLIRGYRIVAKEMPKDLGKLSRAPLARWSES
jgi:5-oxoprolinase (ATP-hydrolysing)